MRARLTTPPLQATSSARGVSVGDFPSPGPPAVVYCTQAHSGALRLLNRCTQLDAACSLRRDANFNMPAWVGARMDALVEPVGSTRFAEQVHGWPRVPRARRGVCLMPPPAHLAASADKVWHPAAPAAGPGRKQCRHIDSRPLLFAPSLCRGRPSFVLEMTLTSEVSNIVTHGLGK